MHALGRFAAEVIIHAVAFNSIVADLEGARRHACVKGNEVLQPGGGTARAHGGGVHARLRHVVLELAQWPGVDAIVIDAPLRLQAVQKLKELHVGDRRAGDVPQRGGLLEHVAAAVDERVRGSDRCGQRPHRRAHHGVEHLDSERDFEVAVGKHGLRYGQVVRVQCCLRERRFHPEGGQRGPVREQEHRIKKTRRERRPVRRLIGDGRAPLAGQVLASLEARRVVEQEVRVAKVGERDIPVGVGQRQPLRARRTGREQCGQSGEQRAESGENPAEHGWLCFHDDSSFGVQRLRAQQPEEAISGQG